MIAGLVLAGGRATRMGGGDKPLRMLGGRPLLAHVLERLAPQVQALALNANGDAARLAGFGLPVLADPVPDQPGPLAGVLTGLDWAAGLGATALLCVPGDTPFLPRDLVARLAPHGFAMAASPDATGALRQHPTVALWPVTQAAPLRAALLAGERRVGYWAASMGAQVVAFQGRPDPFFNVNTPEDLALAEALL